jgi:hypothetical protein
MILASAGDRGHTWTSACSLGLRRCPVLLAGWQPERAFGDIGLLFVDGHGDAWPPQTSPWKRPTWVGLPSVPSGHCLASSVNPALLRREAIAILGPRMRRLEHLKCPVFGVRCSI